MYINYSSDTIKAMHMKEESLDMLLLRRSRLYIKSRHFLQQNDVHSLKQEKSPKSSGP